MTKSIILALIIVVFNFSNASARARIPICYPCESLTTVQDIPANSEIEQLAGEKVKLAYINEEYGIMFMSLWNTGGKYVLSDVSENNVFEINDEVKKLLLDKHNINIETANNPLSFWKRIGGKFVIVLLVLLLIYGAIPKKNNKEKVTQTNV